MAIKRKTRMYEPWGYRDENNYESAEIIHENDLDKFFTSTIYNKDDNKIYFSNKDGEQVASLDVNEFVKSDTIIDNVEYNDGILTITFTNGDVITINLSELLDENEFKDGLVVDNHTIKVLVDSESEPYLSVSEDGVKISGVDAAIQVETDRAISAETVLDEKIEEEIERAQDAETILNEKIDDETARAISAETANYNRILQETANRIAAVNDEKNRAEGIEQTLTTSINNEISRATRTEQQLDNRIDIVSENLSSEITRAQAKEQELSSRLTTEINDRNTAISNEQSRAISAETALQTSINNESQRAQNAEEALNDRIDEIISGSPIEQLDELIEKLGYKDNDTLITNNEHEVAFGEWNVSNTDENPSGQTIFSIGIGTDENNRMNALEVRKDGGVYIWVEGDFMNINQLLGQIAHEVYDNNP